MNKFELRHNDHSICTIPIDVANFEFALVKAIAEK